MVHAGSTVLGIETPFEYPLVRHVNPIRSPESPIAQS